MKRNDSVSIYLFKVNSRNSRTRYEICSKLTIKTPERRQWYATVPYHRCINCSVDKVCRLHDVLSYSRKLIHAKCLRDHSFSTYAKFAEKLTFLTHWYAHVRTKLMIISVWVAQKNGCSPWLIHANFFEAFIHESKST